MLEITTESVTLYNHENRQAINVVEQGTLKQPCLFHADFNQDLISSTVEHRSNKALKAQ